MNLKVIIFFYIISISPFIFGSTINQTEVSAFNEYLVAEPTPVVQLQFVYNLLPDYAITGGSGITGLSTSGSGSVTQGTGMAFLNTSTTTGSAAVIASKARLSYQSSQGANTIFSVIFDTGTTGNNQYIGLGNASDGFFFGYTGTQFGVLQRNNTNDSWTLQASWNGDPVNTGLSGTSAFTLNPQFGNVYSIQYQWLGFGAIKFYVQNPNDGTWVLAHTIRYPNSTGAGPSVGNPALQLLAVTINNTGSTGNVTLKVPCMAGQIEGYQAGAEVYTRFSKSVTGSVTTTQRTFLSIQNNVTYNGSNNQAMVFPDTLSIVNGSTSVPLSATLFINPSVSGASFTNVASNSVVSSDTSITGIAGGRVIMTFFLTANINTPNNINLSDQEISLSPGDVLVVALQSGSGTLTPIGVGLSWYEKQ